MSALAQINHLLNFLAPALWVGTVVAVMARILYRKSLRVPALYAQAAINSVAGGGALVAGLWYFGNDGKMATYGAMVLVCSLTQALSLRR